MLCWHGPAFCSQPGLSCPKLADTCTSAVHMHTRSHSPAHVVAIGQGLQNLQHAATSDCRRLKRDPIANRISIACTPAGSA